MRIGIVTQPLLNNYGGIIQNYALQSILKKMGYTPVTIDYIPPKKNVVRRLASWLKGIVFHKRIQKNLLERKPQFEEFVTTKIEKTPTIHHYCEVKCFKPFDAFVVGSDQVWRPKYNGEIIKDMFLKFCAKEKKVKRIAYAASFGVDGWEFSAKQTKACSNLARRFDAVSVREKSGERLCRDYFGIEVSWVLDPTLLLTRDDYCNICKEVPIAHDILFAYVLNRNDEIQSICEKIAEERKLNIKIVGSDSGAELTIPEWLAMFRDASYVVTDSFHGTVFSIVFGKEFKCFYNKGRGTARFESLMNLYNSGKLEEMREFSIDWLKKALDC